MGGRRRCSQGRAREDWSLEMTVTAMISMPVKTLPDGVWSSDIGTAARFETGALKWKIQSRESARPIFNDRHHITTTSAARPRKPKDQAHD